MSRAYDQEMIRGRGTDKEVDFQVVVPKVFTFCSLQGAQSESSASQSLSELDGGLKALINVRLGRV
jgi:hypothetical protein